MKHQLLSALMVAAVAGCARPVDDRTLSVHGFVGAEVSPSNALPDLTFIDTKGQPYRLVEETKGKVVLLFFGYTHCPDVCPVHLANLGAVLKKLPDEVTRNVMVVFVTTDPARDSLPLLEAWVKGFDPSFIALSGTDSVLIAAQIAAGVPPAERDTTGRGGNYLVGHAAQVIGYSTDRRTQVWYAFGTRQKDWAHDIPLLVALKGS